MPHARELLREIKLTTAASRPALAIPVGAPVRAFLRPISTSAGLLDREELAALTAWRNRYVSAFLTQFDASEARTAAWLTHVVASDDSRILFSVRELSHRMVGYIGLAFIDWEQSSGEADAVVRGEEAPPGLMTEALATLLGWARTQLRLTTLGVRVRSDNSALEFYRKAGFVELRRIPIVARRVGDEVHWQEEPDGDAAVTLVHMEYRQ